jgi:hypothetical protein
MRKALIALVFMPAPAFAENASWHFLSQSYGGTISLVKNLTKDECDFMYNRAKHLPATPDEKAAAQMLADREKAASAKRHAEYIEQHPECANPPSDQNKMTCDIGYGLNLSLQSYMVTSGDIATAECFE